MSNPINLEKPLIVGGQPVYPPTTAQQVLMPDGTRLNAYLETFQPPEGYNSFSEAQKVEIQQIAEQVILNGSW